MGTRADFYLGTGKDAEWLASIAWDGYPDGIDSAVMEATTEEAFKAELAKFLQPRDDVTLPERGWPWPWDNSGTTDYSYWFADGKVYVSNFGNLLVPYAGWLKANEDELDDFSKIDGAITHDMPDMSSRKNLTLGKRSGLLIIGG